MAVRINFIDGTNVVIDASLDDVEAAYKKALSNGGPLRINTEAGSVVLNPQQVVYFETPGVVNANGDATPIGGPRRTASRRRQPA
jgi:hypothetical protein